MNKRGQIYIGAGLIFIGLLAIISNVFEIRFGALFWPIILIGGGLFLIFKPQIISERSGVEFKLLGDLHRSGFWKVSPQELWLGIGDIKLDFSNAEKVEGVTKIRIYSFINDTKITLPADAAVKIEAVAFLTDSHVFGQKQDFFVSPFKFTSTDYETSSQKIQIEMYSFIQEVHINQ